MGASLNVVPMTIAGREVEVEYYYYPGEDEIHTLPNGDPGTPGSPPSAEMVHVWCELVNDRGNINLVDILEFVEPEGLSDEIIEKYHD